MKPHWQEKLEELGEGIRLMQTSDINAIWDSVRKLPVLLSGASDDNETTFKALLLARDTITFIIAEGGLVYFTSVVPNDSAFFHGVAWENRVHGRPDLARKVLGYAFDVLKFHRIAAVVNEDNRLAAQYAESLGFTREGVLREFIDKHGGGRANALYYALLRKEFDHGREQREPSREHEGRRDQDGDSRVATNSRREPAAVVAGDAGGAGPVRRWCRAVRRAICTGSA